MKFKVIEWVRKVRNENYEKTRQMTAKEKIEQTREQAEELRKKLKSAKI